MTGAALLLLLLNASTCCAFGFKSCSQNFPRRDVMWSSNRNIVNLSEVIDMIPENVTTINLSKNKIGVVLNGSFSRVTGLKRLDLSLNELVSIKGGEFKGLNILEVLNLMYNKISYIHSEAFEGFTSLRTLLLAYNALAHPVSLLFDFLPAIEAVDLSLNTLKSFSCQDFGSSSTLRFLNISANRIQRLNVSCFPALEYIRLSNNTKLELQPDAFASNQKMKALLLQSVGVEALMGLSAEIKKRLTFVWFSLFVERSQWTICDVLKGMDTLHTAKIDLKGSKLPAGNTSLLDCPTPAMVCILDAQLGNVARLSSGRRRTSRLYLINCGLEQVSSSTFKSYPGLKTLYLNQNHIHIENDTFRGLTRLTFLSLDKNHIRDVDCNWFVPLKRLTRLSLMKNEITELRPNAFAHLVQLEQLYLQFNLLKSILKKTFTNLSKLRKLNLSLNLICFIEEGTFQDLTNLRYLDLSGNRLRRLTPEILLGLENLANLILYNNRLNFRSYESPFINLTSLKYLEMRYQGPGGQGLGNIGPRFFRDLNQLIQVAFGNSVQMNIQPGAFAPLVNLKNLYIAGVIMKATNFTEVLSPLKKLRKLALYRTDLDTLPTNLLPPNNSLEVLQVQSNHIRVVSKEVLDNLPRLRIFDVSENPLSCTCDNTWFKTWALDNRQTQVPYLYDMKCDNSRRSPYLWQFDNKACSYDQGPALRYLMLMVRAKLGGRRGAAAKARFQYDAFISYSSRDEGWVMGQLLPNLERPAAGAPGLRLCLHHRDFRPGAAVLENIEAAIYSSRHTICVITRHYLQSEWCSVEFQLASLRLLCDGRDVLLLVFLEQIPEHCLSLYTRLRKIVRKKTYLLWPENPQEQDSFWVRMIDALKDNEEEEERKGEQQLAPLIG